MELTLSPADELIDVAAVEPPSTVEPSASDPEAVKTDGPTDAAPAVEPGEIINAEFEVTEDAADAAFKARVRKASDNVAETALAEARTREVHKLAKKAFEAAVAELNGIIGRGPEHFPLFDHSPPAVDSASIAPDGSDTPAAQPTDADGPLSGDVWRTVDIDALQLPPGLTERLRGAGCNTMGELEDLRAKGDIPGAGLRSVPRVGPAAVTKIEDAVVSWLSTHRDIAVLAASANGQPSTPIDTHASADHTDEIVDPQVLADVEAIRQRFRELNEAGSYEARDFPRVWQSGRDAHNRGDRFEDCPYVPGLERDDWLRGWMSAHFGLNNDGEPKQTRKKRDKKAEAT